MSSFILCNNNKLFLNRIVTCNKQWILYNWWWPAQWLHWADTPKSKSFPKVKLAPKIGHGHYLVVCCRSNWPQLPESQWNHYIWEVCSAIWWDALKTATPVAGIGQQKRSNSSPWQCPTAHHTTNPMLQQLKELVYEVLPHPPYSPDLLPTDYHFIKHLDNLLQGKCFHNEQEAENAF